MAGNFSENDDEVISGINVTPLVDVVLVLLVIFMITAPAIYQSVIKVQLPKASTGEESKKSPLNFTLNSEGDIFWGEEKLSWEELGNRLKGWDVSQSEETALISADQTTPHGTVIRLMDLLRQHGLFRFALNVEGRPPQSH